MQKVSETKSADTNPTREQVQAILRAAGMLSTTWDDIKGAKYLSASEIQALQKGIPADASTEAYINEQRGPH